MIHVILHMNLEESRTQTKEVVVWDASYIPGTLLRPSSQPKKGGVFLPNRLRTGRSWTGFPRPTCTGSASGWRWSWYRQPRSSTSPDQPQISCVPFQWVTCWENVTPNPHLSLSLSHTHTKGKAIEMAMSDLLGKIHFFLSLSVLSQNEKPRCQLLVSLRRMRIYSYQEMLGYL